MHNVLSNVSGTIEVALQSSIQFQALASARLFSNAFKISEEEILLACDDDTNLLNNKTVSRKDQNNYSLKDDSEIFEHFCMEKSLTDSKNEELKSEFSKVFLIFGG